MTPDIARDLDQLLGREQRDVLLHMAIDHVERSLAVIATAGQATARGEAHALRGAVAPLGADVLAALLARVEAGEAGLLGALSGAATAFIAACRAASPATYGNRTPTTADDATAGMSIIGGQQIVCFQ